LASFRHNVASFIFIISFVCRWKIIKLGQVATHVRKEGKSFLLDVQLVAAFGRGKSFE